MGRTIPKITEESGPVLLDEIDEFEKEFAKTNPKSMRDWAVALDEAVIGKAKTWRDYVILHQPGKALYDALLRDDAVAGDYGAYYRYVRAELFQRCGLEHENPGESSKRRWNNIRIPEHIQCKEDLDEVLETIILVYGQLVKHGMIVPEDDNDERRLVVDLGEKCEKGTEFYKWFYGGDVPVVIATVRQWIDRARRYIACLLYTSPSPRDRG